MKSVNLPTAAACILGLILVWAFWLRLGYNFKFGGVGGLAASASQSLDADAIGYWKFAETRSGYNTEFREPLWIWWIQCARVLLFGGPYDAMVTRLAGVVAGLAAIMVLFWFTLRKVGLLAATVAACFYAAAPFLVEFSSRGLREDLINALMILFLALVLNMAARMPVWRDYALAGVVGAALCLIRLNSVVFIAVTVAAAFGWSYWRHRRESQRLWFALPALSAVIIFAALLPHCLSMKMLYGDPFFAVNKDIRFYANQEFAGIRPGFPTRAEFEKEAYSGGKITLGEYLFEHHSVSEVFGGMSRGARRLFVGDYLDYAYGPNRGPLLLVVHIAGLLCLLLPGRRLIFAAFILFSAPSLFLASYNWFDHRLLLNAYMLFYLGIGALAQTVWDVTWRAKVSRRGPWPWQQQILSDVREIA